MTGAPLLSVVAPSVPARPDEWDSVAALVRSSRAVLRQLADQAQETASLAVMRSGVLTYVAEATATLLTNSMNRKPYTHTASTSPANSAYATP